MSVQRAGILKESSWFRISSPKLQSTVVCRCCTNLIWDSLKMYCFPSVKLWSCPRAWLLWLEMSVFTARLLITVNKTGDPFLPNALEHRWLLLNQMFSSCFLPLHFIFLFHSSVTFRYGSSLKPVLVKVIPFSRFLSCLAVLLVNPILSNLNLPRDLPHLIYLMDHLFQVLGCPGSKSTPLVSHVSFKGCFIISHLSFPLIGSWSSD